MAKLSLIARQKKRVKLVARLQEKRAQLKVAGNHQALDKLPHNGLAVRLHNRCWQCGRPRAYMRAFGTCRLCFKKLVAAGYIPGITKASW